MLQILFQVNTVVPSDIWINHLLLVDKLQCTNSLPLLAFYKFLYLCKLSTISEGELPDFVYLLKSINPFFDYKTQRDAHEALILLLDIFSNICNLPLKDNKISYFSRICRFFLLWNLQNFLYLSTMPRNKYLLRTLSPYYCTTKYRYIFIFGQRFP